eukprot:3131018-Rhodomonas_salina.2
MSFDFPVPASYFQMKDTLRLWANESGLAAYASSMFGTDSGSPNSRDKSTSDGNSWEQDTFGARIEVVQMHLNLSVKPFVIYGVEDIDRGRELLQQAYRSEPLFQWVLGDLKNDPQVRRGVVCVPVPCHPEAHTFSRGCGGGGQKRGAEGS